MRPLFDFFSRWADRAGDTPTRLTTTRSGGGCVSHSRDVVTVMSPTEHYTMEAKADAGRAVVSRTERGETVNVGTYPSLRLARAALAQFVADATWQPARPARQWPWYVAAATAAWVLLGVHGEAPTSAAAQAATISAATASLARAAPPQTSPTSSTALPLTCN